MVDNKPEHVDIMNYRIPSDPALQYAWRYFNAYDSASGIQKNKTTDSRMLIIGCLFVTTALASISTFFDSTIIRYFFLVSLAILPIITALLMRKAQHLPNVQWVVSRVTAETIKREIYLYRAEAGDYSNKVILAEIEQVKSKQPNLPEYLQNSGTYANRPNAELMRIIRQQKLNWQVQQAQEPVRKSKDLASYLQNQTDKNEPNYTDHTQDNGFSEITIDQYKEYRIIPQTKWYKDRAEKDRTDYAKYRDISLYITAAGTVFGLGGFEWLGSHALVAISTALGLAVATYIQLKMYGQTYNLYYSTKNKLDYEKAQLDASPKAQDEEETSNLRAFFVTKFENIFQEERTYWIQRALQSQIAAEMTMINNIDDWVRSQFDLVIQNEVDIKTIFGD